MCELRSEAKQMSASVVSPNLTRDLEAKTESQRYETQSLQGDLQTTQAVNRRRRKREGPELAKRANTYYAGQNDYRQDVVHIFGEKQ